MALNLLSRNKNVLSLDCGDSYIIPYIYYKLFTLKIDA